MRIIPQMQTISTKLDKKTAQKFLEICNDEGKCQSEFLRDLIEQMIETDDIEEKLGSEPKTISEIKNPTIEFIYD